MFDAHTHAVSPDTEGFPRRRPDFPTTWLDHNPPSGPDLEAELQAAGVSGAVLVQPQGAYAFDNRYVLAEGVRSPLLHTVVSVDMTDPDRADEIDRSADAGAVGVRLFSIPTPDRPWLAASTTFDGWEVFRDRALVVSVCCFADELDAVAQVAAQFADVDVVLDHCAFVDLSGGAAGLDPVVGLGNVHLKVTGHVLHGLDRADVDTAATVAALAARVGGDRLLWGSDWPQTGLSYDSSIVTATRAARSLGASAAEDFLGTTAIRLYGQSMV